MREGLLKNRFLCFTMGAVLLGTIGVVSAGQPVTLTDAELEKVTVHLGSSVPHPRHRRTGSSRKRASRYERHFIKSTSTMRH